LGYCPSLAAATSHRPRYCASPSWKMDMKPSLNLDAQTPLDHSRSVPLAAHKLNIVWLFLSAIILSAFYCQASSVPPLLPVSSTHFVERLDLVSIDWTSGLIYALGRCELTDMDEAQAAALARQNAADALVAALLDIRVSAAERVSDLMALRGAPALRLSQLASSTSVLWECVQYGKTPSACVFLGLDVKGFPILPLLVEGVGVGDRQSGLVMPTPVPADASAEWLSAIRHPTGLIIDASRVSLKPALCPAIFAQDGRLVFDVRYARRLSFMQNGGITYMSGTDAARISPLVGQNPKIVEAISAAGHLACDVVISNDDADRLIFLRGRLPFLAECRIIIVSKL